MKKPSSFREETSQISAKNVKNIIYSPPCKCPSCRASFRASDDQKFAELSYNGTLSNSEVISTVDENLRRIQECRTYLMQILALRADTIMKRWKKRSRTKRGQLLMEIDPGLSPHPWLVARLPCLSGNQVHAFRNATWRRRLLTPWLNLEDLKTDPNFLFLLLNCRTEYPPEDWASWDDRQLCLPWSRGYFEVNFSKSCIAISGSEYGKFLDLDHGSRHLKNRNDIGFPRAQLLLEAQANLMHFLRTVVERILEGADLSKQPCAARWDRIISESIRPSSETVTWSSYTEQTYSKPPALCIESLFSIAQASQRAIGDHLGLLQSDSSYMRRFIRMYIGQKLHRGVDGNSLMPLLVLQEITEDTLQCWKWKWIADKWAQAKEVYDQYQRGKSSSCLTRLQTKYNNTLWSLEIFLIQCFRGDLQRLRDTLRSRPGFLYHWKNKNCPDDTSQEFQKKQRTVSFQDDPLDWCIARILEDLDTPNGYDHTMLFSFLQSHLAKSPRSEQARVDETLSRRLSDMASIHHMIESVRLNRPRHGSQDISDELSDAENIRLWRNVFFRPNFSHESIGNPEDVGKALVDQMCRHPRQQESDNRAYLRPSQPADEALAKFWAHIRRWAKLYLGYLDIESAEKAELLGLVFFDMIPENTGINRLPAQGLKRVLSDSVECPSKPKKFSFQTQWGPTEVFAPPMQAIKHKVKSRHPASPQVTAERGVEKPENLQVDAPSQIYACVKKGTLHVIRLMFSEASEDKCESVSWEKFLRAMCDAGCVTRNGGGSAVTFEAKDMQSGLYHGRIIFHRPHPVSKLDSIMLRSMGKRMNKWFSWSPARFRVRE